jgi:polyisoprenoid-binding protein YceI
MLNQARLLRTDPIPLAATWLAGAAICLGLLTACDNEPAQGKSQASVAEPVATAQAPLVGATKYTFSQAGSKFEFVGAKVTGKHDGAFEQFSGTIQLPEGKAEAGSVNVDVDMASLTADDPKLTGHLKSPDLFDVAKFPKARFTSTGVTAGGAGGATHTVTGNLELHGVTKSITFPATIALGADAVDVNAEFAINRKDFGVNYPGMPNDLIKDDILVKLKLHATKASG